MLVSDVSRLCLRSYDTGQNPTAWDELHYGPEDQHIWLGLRDYVDATVMVFRGSKTILDWYRDFQAFAVFVNGIGKVEQGFSTGLPELLDILVRNGSVSTKVPLIIAGHSLGAARAAIAGGLLINRYGIIPQAVVGFGMPKPGFSKLTEVLSPVRKLLIYRNRTDPVPTKPLTNELFPYELPRALLPMNERPSYVWELGLEDHDMALYDLGAQALKGEDAAL